MLISSKKNYKYSVYIFLKIREIFEKVMLIKKININS